MSYKNRFDVASEQLADRMKTNAKRAIIYHRGSETVILEAWEGQTVFRTDTRERTYLDWGGKDFLMLWSDLILSNQKIEPQLGDWITRVGPDGSIEQYEVSAPAGEPVWRKSDQEGYIIRVHTRLTQHAG